MPRLTGHFDAVVRGEPRCVTFVFDCDDEEACYECVEVSVPGLVLDKAERRRLLARACDAAAHRSWREGAGASSGKAEPGDTKAKEAPAQAEPRRAA
jgi:hypothetical protein